MSPLLITSLVTLSWCLPITEAIDCIPNTRFSHPLNCSMFIMCDMKGNPRQIPCPEGLLYNDVQEKCDWPHNVNCTQEEGYAERNHGQRKEGGIKQVTGNENATKEAVSLTKPEIKPLTNSLLNKTIHKGNMNSTLTPEIKILKTVLLNKTNQTDTKNSTDPSDESVILNKLKVNKDKIIVAETNNKTEVVNGTNKNANKTGNVSKIEESGKINVFNKENTIVATSNKTEVVNGTNKNANNTGNITKIEDSGKMNVLNKENIIVVTSNETNVATGTIENANHTSNVTDIKEPSKNKVKLEKTLLSGAKTVEKAVVQEKTTNSSIDENLKDLRKTTKIVVKRQTKPELKEKETEKKTEYVKKEENINFMVTSDSNDKGSSKTIAEVILTKNLGKKEDEIKKEVHAAHMKKELNEKEEINSKEDTPGTETKTTPLKSSSVQNYTTEEQSSTEKLNEKGESKIKEDAPVTEIPIAPLKTIVVQNDTTKNQSSSKKPNEKGESKIKGDTTLTYNKIPIVPSKSSVVQNGTTKEEDSNVNEQVEFNKTEIGDFNNTFTDYELLAPEETDYVSLPNIQYSFVNFNLTDDDIFGYDIESLNTNTTQTNATNSESTLVKLTDLVPKI